MPRVRRGGAQRRQGPPRPREVRDSLPRRQLVLGRARERDRSRANDQALSTAFARPGRLLGTIRAESYCAASAMTQRQAISGWLKANLDPSVLWFVLHAFASFTAFYTWQDEIVRAIKGEEAKDEWKTNMPTSLLIVFWTL